MTILCSLVNCNHQPKQQLDFIAKTLCEELTQHEVITLTGILLRLTFQASDKKSFKVFSENYLVANLLEHIAKMHVFYAPQQSKGYFIQRILEAYHLEQSILDKKQEVFRNQVLATQLSLDLKHQEVEIACAPSTPEQDKNTLATFKLKYKISKKALKLSQQNLLQTLSQINALKLKIKEILKEANDFFLIMLAPLYAECQKKYGSRADHVFTALVIYLINYQADLGQTCAKAALPFISKYLRKLARFPDKVFSPFLQRLRDALEEGQLVHLSSQTEEKIKHCIKESESLKIEAEVIEAPAPPPVKQNEYIPPKEKENVWSHFFLKRNVLYN